MPGSFPPWLPGIAISAANSRSKGLTMSMTDSEIGTCSAKDCREPAAVQLVWNNPKLHSPDRRKVWLACPDHEKSLADFLAARGFLRSTEPISA